MGVNKGLHRAVTHSERILHGENAFCESLVRATGDLDRTRMHVQRALLRSIAYLVVLDPVSAFLKLVECLLFLNFLPLLRTRPDRPLSGICHFRAAYGEFSEAS